MSANAGGVDPVWVREALGCAESAAREAGKLLRESLNWVGTKGLKRKREIVTDADHASEKVILEHLRRHYPDHSVRTEESGEIGRESPFRWWVDPLDGTNSFAHGYPHFSVSIALEEATEGLLAGVVYDPMRDELFAASVASQATLNGGRIQVSRIEKLADALVATGFPYDREPDNQNNLPEFNAMIMAIQGIRRGGSAALDLCYVAAGRLDAYWELKLNPWDVAAGGLIALRAGGEVTNIGADHWDHTIHHIAASNGLVHLEMQRVLAGARMGRAGRWD